MTNQNIETGDTVDDMMSLKRMLSQEEWANEARQIPIEELPVDEQAILIKCINHNDLTDDELNKLEEILGRYRETLAEVQPEETVQAVKDNIQHIHDCDTFLEKLEQVRREEIQTIPFNLPTSEGTISVELDVYPITDSTILFDPNSHFAPFMEQNEEALLEQDVNPYTLEDKQVREQVRQQAQEVLNDEISFDMMIELLSHQTCLHGEERNPEKMEQIYRAMPSVYVAALTTRIQPLILEPVYSVDMDEVFQEISQ